eukprot:CAMPEP_0119413592 /NCGR_PEP_ID=MMETSP1335-20130426/5630_1 /TAXON_ID=259385 /ORGANISM="Chrysoculter rhomboideus, Strain RCC1486" /LENGTH=31 /DNA_ID= /DNA_START= /DNA_END= /DNA_ORIENTATION=
MTEHTERAVESTAVPPEPSVCDAARRADPAE